MLLETKIWELDLLIATGVSFYLDPQQTEQRHICVYESVYIHISAFLSICIYIKQIMSLVPCGSFYPLPLIYL